MAAFLRLLRVEDKRHGTVVDRGDLHVRAEFAALHMKALRFTFPDEPLIERLGEFGLRRLRKARATAFEVGIQRELGDDEQAPARRCEIQEP